MSEKVTCFFSLQELEKRKGSGLPIGQKDKKDKKKNKLMKDIMAARELQAYEEQKEEVNVPYNVIFVSRPHTCLWYAFHYTTNWHFGSAPNATVCAQIVAWNARD